MPANKCYKCRTRKPANPTLLDDQYGQVVARRRPGWESAWTGRGSPSWRRATRWSLRRVAVSSRRSRPRTTSLSRAPGRWAAPSRPAPDPRAGQARHLRDRRPGLAEQPADLPVTPPGPDRPTRLGADPDLVHPQRGRPDPVRHATGAARACGRHRDPWCQHQAWRCPWGTVAMSIAATSCRADAGIDATTRVVPPTDPRPTDAGATDHAAAARDADATARAVAARAPAGVPPASARRQSASAAPPAVPPPPGAPTAEPPPGSSQPPIVRTAARAGPAATARR